MKMSDCKFVVNKEKNKVVCIYEDTQHDAMYYMWENLDIEFGSLTSAKNKMLNMPNRFVGIATCSAEDEWDETFGRKLAFQRMRHHYYTSFFKAINRFVDHIDSELSRIVTTTNEFGEKISKTLDYKQKEIDAYLEK